MKRPRLSWNPIRFVPSFVEKGRPTIREWLELAYEFGLPCVEIYYGLRPSREAGDLRNVRQILDRNELGVSMYTCAPDFGHPDAAERERQLAMMLEEVERAQILEAEGIRVTAGCVHEGVSRDDALRWAAESLARLADYAEPRGVKLGLENHYKDRLWSAPDVVFHTAEFLQLFELLRDTAVGVNFDASNQLMTGDDPMTVLEVVAQKVWHVHASDRQPGEYAHSVVGEGSVDFDPIFACLAHIGYSGCISLEDGNPEGDEGTLRGLRFLRRKIIEHWS